MAQTPGICGANGPALLDLLHAPHEGAKLATAVLLSCQFEHTGLLSRPALGISHAGPPPSLDSHQDASDVLSHQELLSLDPAQTSRPLQTLTPGSLRRDTARPRPATVGPTALLRSVGQVAAALPETDLATPSGSNGPRCLTDVGLAAQSSVDAAPGPSQLPPPQRPPPKQPWQLLQQPPPEQLFLPDELQHGRVEEAQRQQRQGKTAIGGAHGGRPIFVRPLPAAVGAPWRSAAVPPHLRRHMLHPQGKPQAPALIRADDGTIVGPAAVVARELGAAAAGAVSHGQLRRVPFGAAASAPAVADGRLGGPFSGEDGRACHLDAAQVTAAGGTIRRRAVAPPLFAMRTQAPGPPGGEAGLLQGQKGKVRRLLDLVAVTGAASQDAALGGGAGGGGRMGAAEATVMPLGTRRWSGGDGGLPAGGRPQRAVRDAEGSGEAPWLQRGHEANADDGTQTVQDGQIPSRPLRSQPLAGRAPVGLTLRINGCSYELELPVDVESLEGPIQLELRPAGVAAAAASAPPAAPGVGRGPRVALERRDPCPAVLQHAPPPPLPPRVASSAAARASGAPMTTSLALKPPLSSQQRQQQQQDQQAEPQEGPSASTLALLQQVLLERAELQAQADGAQQLAGALQQRREHEMLGLQLQQFHGLNEDEVLELLLLLQQQKRRPEQQQPGQRTRQPEGLPQVLEGSLQQRLLLQRAQSLQQRMQLPEQAMAVRQRPLPPPPPPPQPLGRSDLVAGVQSQLLQLLLRGQHPPETRLMLLEELLLLLQQDGPEEQQHNLERLLHEMLQELLQQQPAPTPVQARARDATAVAAATLAAGVAEETGFALADVAVDWDRPELAAPGGARGRPSVGQDPLEGVVSEPRSRAAEGHKRHAPVGGNGGNGIYGGDSVQEAGRSGGAAIGVPLILGPKGALQVPQGASRKGVPAGCGGSDASGGATAAPSAATGGWMVSASGAKRCVAAGTVAPLCGGWPPQGDVYWGPADPAAAAAAAASGGAGAEPGPGSGGPGGSADTRMAASESSTLGGAVMGPAPNSGPVDDEAAGRAGRKAVATKARRARRSPDAAEGRPIAKRRRSLPAQEVSIQTGASSSSGPAHPPHPLAQLAPPSQRTLLEGSGRPRRTRNRMAPTMADCVAYGLVPVGSVKLTVGRLEEGEVTVEITTHGEIVYNGITYPSLSSFALAVLRCRNSVRLACDGWHEVRIGGRKMEDFRQLCVQRMVEAGELSEDGVHRRRPAVALIGAAAAGGVGLGAGGSGPGTGCGRVEPGASSGGAVGPGGGSGIDGDVGLGATGSGAGGGESPSAGREAGGIADGAMV